MKNLIMTAVAVSSLTFASSPVFALKAPVSGAKVPQTTCVKAKGVNGCQKLGLKHRAALVGIKKTK